MRSGAILALSMVASVSERREGVKLGVHANLSGHWLFPSDNAWNLDISRLPCDRRSDRTNGSIVAP